MEISTQSSATTDYLKGISVSHIDRKQLAYGPGDPAAYFINPIGIQSVILSANELSRSTSLTLDGLGAFSVNVNLAPTSSAPPMMTFPLVQGMGFVTAVYNNATPLLQSGVSFTSLTYGGLVSGTPTARYTIRLNDDTYWELYVTPSAGINAPTMTLSNNMAIIGSRLFSGCIQVAKNPTGATSQALYDESAGVYALRGSVAGMADKSVGKYRLSWTKGGSIGRPLLMFALPHHIQSMSETVSTRSRTILKLVTTTKGIATAVVGDHWDLQETSLPYDMGFAPWSPTLRSQTKLSDAAVSLIHNVSSVELAQDMIAQSNFDSMYFSGKVRFQDIMTQL